MQIKIKTPAKINLGLEVLGVRKDGFHDIASIMQTISLYDYLDFTFAPSDTLEIILSGNCQEIPYNEKNIACKAIKLFYSEVNGLKPYRISVHIKKNIPVQAGLGGGSSNAAGVIWTLNKVLNTNLSLSKIDELCAALGSDLNVCYHGGTCYAEGRGERLTQILSNYKSGVSIIKPINFGITAKDGYQMFDSLKLPPKEPSKVLKLKNALITGKNISPLIHNDLEIAPLYKYSVLKKIKKAYSNSMMTGSGSAFFVLESQIQHLLPVENYQFITGLEFTDEGITEA